LTICCNNIYNIYTHTRTHHSTQSLALALALDKEKGLEEDGLQKLLDTPAIKAELGRRNLSFRLDVVMSYLRRVHFVVYYGGDEFQDEGDLIFLAVRLFASFG
jgi:hypothetical protein